MFNHGFVVEGFSFIIMCPNINFVIFNFVVHIAAPDRFYCEMNPLILILLIKYDLQPEMSI